MGTPRFHDRRIWLATAIGLLITLALVFLLNGCQPGRALPRNKAKAKRACEEWFGPCGDTARTVTRDTVWEEVQVEVPGATVRDTQYVSQTDTVRRRDTLRVTDASGMYQLKRWYDSRLRAYVTECEGKQRQARARVPVETKTVTRTVVKEVPPAWLRGGLIACFVAGIGLTLVIFWLAQRLREKSR